MNQETSESLFYSGGVSVVMKLNKMLQKYKHP